MDRIAENIAGLAVWWVPFLLALAVAGLIAKRAAGTYHNWLHRRTLRDLRNNPAPSGPEGHP